MRFKTVEAERKYWHIKKLCTQFISDWRDVREKNGDSLSVARKFARDINSDVNLIRAIDRVDFIFKRSNYQNVSEEDIMKIFGYDFSRSIHRK